MTPQQRDALDQLLRDGPLDIGGDVDIQRPVFEAMAGAQPLPSDVAVTRRLVGGIPVIDIEIAAVNTTDVILYFHGGGYALGSASASVGLASDLSRQAKTRAISVDYRLAPEHPHPAAVDDALAAYRGLLEEGQPASRLAVAGESAGAGLTLATLITIRDAGLPLPCAAVLMSPWADLTLSAASMVSKAAVDPVLSAAALRRRADDYVGTFDRAAPLVSPLFADLHGLPPLLIQAGSHEILIDDATRLAARAAAADLTVSLEITAGVPHVFQGFAGILDEAGTALANAGAFIRTHLDS
jgi:monoterpene epsilon-lactone hydrolase